MAIIERPISDFCCCSIYDPCANQYTMTNVNPPAYATTTDSWGNWVKVINQTSTSGPEFWYSDSDEFKELLGIVKEKKKENNDTMKKGIMNFVMPVVDHVDIYNDRVVKVTFTDGSFTKAECSADDAKNGKFDIDTGITICLIKKMLGKNGHRLYNNWMRDIHETMKKNEADKKKADEERVARKARNRKIVLKKAAKKAKERQDQIDINKEAFIEAMRAYDKETGDDMT